MRHIVILGLLVLSLALFASHSHAAEKAFGSEYEQYHDVVLKGASGRELRRFKEFDDSFGTFFVSSDGKTSGWSANAFTKEAADTVARVKCETQSEADCVLYARISPENSTGSYVIPETRWRGWKSAKENVKDGQHVALAVNAWSVLAVSGALDSKDAAMADAMKLCGAASKRIRSKLNSELFDASMKAGLFDCRIAAVK